MYQPITYSLLESINTCRPQLDLVETHFGKTKPIPLTKRVAIKFGSLFDVEWAAIHLLTYADYNDYGYSIISAKKKFWKIDEDAGQEYNKIVVAAREARNKVTEPDWKKYNKVIEDARKKYVNVEKTARKEFSKVVDAALEEYKKVSAAEFIRIYKRGMK